MKKIFSIILASSLCLQGYSQLMQASIGAGSQPNRVKIYLKSDVTQSPSSISTLQFNIGVDATGLLLAPTITIVPTNASLTGFTSNPPYLEGGFWNYNIFTATVPLTPSFTANTEFEALEVDFSNGSPNLGNVALVTLPDGGANTGYALFLATGTVNSNGLGNLYYARPGVIVNNQNSYDPSGGSAGTATSTALINTIVLPIRFVGLEVAKKKNDGIVTWQVENESSLTDRYEIERSLNGVDFQKIAGVLPKNNGNSSNSYDLTDVNLTAIRSTGVIYYRIKQFDKDGKFVTSPIKSLRLDGKGIAIGVFPNPIRNYANVTIDLERDAEVVLTINDASGKQVQTLQLQLFKGLNIKKINMNSLASGSYLMKVQIGTEIKTVPLVKTN